ncbi:MAG: radical SAM protein [Nitrososphaerota archaeon]
MIDLLGEFEKKIKVAGKLRDMIEVEEAREAEVDSHARRLPRPCGLTVHTGLGCSFGCTYCYIYDIGFTYKPKPYPLKGLQLAYSIAVNPSVAIGRNGTLLAFGSITEPFMKETLEKTLEYISTTSRYLENPIQFSTKAYLDREVCRTIYNLQKDISALVTIITIRYSKMLEPSAPTPFNRLETIKNLSNAGVNTCLFLRPIIPGVEISDLRELLEKCMEAGARGVVLGSLRVTEGVIRRLRASGFPHIDMILERLERKINVKSQTTVRTSDIKEKIKNVAEKIGLNIYPSACSANIDSHRIGCTACDMGPCGDLETIPEYSLRDLRELALRYGLKVHEVKEVGLTISLKISGQKRKIHEFTEFTKSILKRRVML